MHTRLWFVLFSVFILLSSNLAMLSAQESCSETVGRTERSDFYDEVIQTRIYYTVYLPPCYDQTERTYPVMYLFHGSNDDDGSWGRLGLYDVLDAGISNGEIPPVIAVTPFGEWVANENRFDFASWDVVFMEGVFPRVEDAYRITDDRSQRAIGGISRGGFWAFNIGLRNPHLFSAIGGHSGFFDPYHVAPEYNPVELVRSVPEAAEMRFWIDRGADDYAAPGLDLMGERLEEAGVEYTYTIHPEGQHWFTYWQEHIEDYVEFYVADWRNDSEIAALPAEEITEEPSSPSIWVTSTPAAPTATPVPTQVVELTPEMTPDFIEATASDEQGLYLLLPTVAMPAFLQANIPMETLNSIRNGENVSNLVLGATVAAQLRELGVPLADGMSIVEDGAVFNTLWGNRQLFTLLPFDQLTTRYRVLNVDELHPIDHDMAMYPFAFMEGEPNFYPDRLTRLLMSGVTAMARQTVPAIDANGVEWASSGIADYARRADFFHMSNEVSIDPLCPQDNGQTLGGTNSMCSKEAHFDVLTNLDVDIVELSGNHNNDYGYEAYLNTLQWYRERDIMTLGGGETIAEARQPIILDHNGNQIAMLACNWVGPYYALVNEDPSLLGGVRPGAAECNRAWLSEIIPQLASENDMVVVTVQYFEFDQFTPTEDQQNDFRWLSDLGADVVIGTSSHFPQIFEYRSLGDREAFIHYGLGNLYFDQDFFNGVHFFMDQLFIYEGQLLTVDLFTGIIEGQGRPRPQTPDERENFLFLMFNRYGQF